jgi:hypothetical protein
LREIFTSSHPKQMQAMLRTDTRIPTENSRLVFAVAVLCFTTGIFLPIHAANTGADQHPVVTSLSPSSGPTGTTVTITGLGFELTSNRVKFSGAEAASSVNSPNGTTLTLTVPKALYGICPSWAPRCPRPIIPIREQSYDVVVESSSQLSNPKPFTVTEVVP